VKHPQATFLHYYLKRKTHFPPVRNHPTRCDHSDGSLISTYRSARLQSLLHCDRNLKEISNSKRHHTQFEGDIQVVRTE
jgi:hypothetical protein